MPIVIAVTPVDIGHDRLSTDLVEADLHGVVGDAAGDGENPEAYFGKEMGGITTRRKEYIFRFYKTF